jgi:flagellar basal body-associated protein FliL
MQLTKEGWIIIGAVFFLFVCVVSSVALGSVSGDAVKAALADDTATASSQLKSTNVCIGIFNLGACTTKQSSTTTTTKTTPPRQESPWVIILVMSVILMAAVTGGIVVFGGPDYVR